MKDVILMLFLWCIDEIILLSLVFLAPFPGNAIIGIIYLFVFVLISYNSLVVIDEIDSDENMKKLKDLWNPLNVFIKYPVFIITSIVTGILRKLTMIII